jgi:TPR repeat protein
MTGDDDKSLDYLKQSASLGWMQAEEVLGIAYLTGDGVAKDTSKVKFWLKKAHEHGSGKAEEIYCSSLPVAKQNTCKF